MGVLKNEYIKQGKKSSYTKINNNFYKSWCEYSKYFGDNNRMI